MKKKILTIVLFMVFKAEAQTSVFKTIDSLSVRGQYKQALFLLSNLDSQNFKSLKKAGDIYYSIDAYKKATQLYEKALELQENYKVQLQLASSYRKEKKYSKAIDIYEKIIRNNTKNLYAIYQVGKLYATTNQIKNALFIFEKLITEDPGNANYRYMLAIVYEKLGKRNKMINSFLASYKNDTTYLKPIYKLAIIFKKIRKKDSSNLFIKKGLELNNNHINFNKLQINNLYLSKKYKKAILLLNHIDSLAPNDLFTQKMLGKSYFYLEQYDEAKKYLKKAKTIDRNEFKTYTYLGHVNRALKNYPLAQLYYLQATSKGKKKRNVEYYSLGLLYLEMKKPKMAINMLKKALVEHRNDYKAKYQLAITSDALYKDKKIAHKLYEEYILDFEGKDKKMTEFAKARLKEITKQLFFNQKKNN